MNTQVETKANPTITLEDQYCAQNYAPLPLVLTRGKGIHLWDDQGKKYIDMMSAYSAVSHGHCHPHLVKTVQKQIETLAIVSRAYHSDKLGPYLKTLCELTGFEQALPMNTGAEAVETAIKAARKWGYTVKGVADNKAEIIACEGNFHGRTTTVVGFSSDPQYQHGFGPFAPGSKIIPYGDADALENAITPNTVAFIVEPIQGEGGIVVPPEGYLKRCRELCTQHNVLLIADEVQAGLGRTGKLLACDHENVRPDGLILGKALGGGCLPVSAFLANHEVMDVFTPGDHGSTFGGNPLSSVVAHEALKLLVQDNYAENSAKLGEYFISELRKISNPAIKDIRGKGLFIGVEVDPSMLSARDVCLKLMDKGVLSKDTHETVIRFAPPLVITKEEIDEALVIIREVL
ncbi:MAG: ornithine--oxo-acid transaminase [Gammaproteobacteria bacterium]